MAKSTKSTKKTVDVPTAKTSKTLAGKSKDVKAKEFAYKSVGQNVILVKGEVKYSRKFPEKLDRDNIKALVETYNVKPTVKVEKEIILLMTVDVEQRKEEIKTGKKPTVKKPAEEKLLSKEEQIAAAKKLLEDNDYQAKAKEAPKSYHGRREY